jgi:hypothetical protein
MHERARERSAATEESRTLLLLDMKAGPRRAAASIGQRAPRVGVDSVVGIGGAA